MWLSRWPCHFFSSFFLSSLNIVKQELHQAAGKNPLFEVFLPAGARRPQNRCRWAFLPRISAQIQGTSHDCWIQTANLHHFHLHHLSLQSFPECGSNMIKPNGSKCNDSCHWPIFAAKPNNPCCKEHSCWTQNQSIPVLTHGRWFKPSKVTKAFHSSRLSLLLRAIGWEAVAWAMGCNW